jgi:hypothetical protein
VLEDLQLMPKWHQSHTDLAEIETKQTDKIKKGIVNFKTNFVQICPTNIPQQCALHIAYLTQLSGVHKKLEFY